MAKRKSLKSILESHSPRSLGSITLCAGTEYEWELEIYPPVGAKWISLYPKLATTVFGLAEEMFSDQAESILAGEEEIPAEASDMSPEEAFKMMEKFGAEEIRDILAPSVFGMDDDPEIAEYFKRFVGPVEFMSYFMEAAMKVISYNQGRPEVDQALKKSEPNPAEEEAEAA